MPSPFKCHVFYGSSTDMEPSDDDSDDDLEIPLLLPSQSFLIDIGKETLADKKSEVEKRAKKEKNRWFKVRNDTWMVIQLTAIRGFLTNYNWLNPTLMIVGTICRDMCMLFLGMICSKFSGAVVDKDITEFTSRLPIGIALIIGITTFSTWTIFSRESLVLQWRQQTVSYTSDWYFCGRYGAHMHNVRNISTSDQRITADVITMTAAMGEFFQIVAVMPISITLFSIYIYTLFGWTVLVSEYVYFFFGIVVTKLVLKLLTPKVYFAEQAEGAFRGAVAEACVYAEPIAFSNPNAESEYWLNDGRKTKESESNKKEAVMAWETRKVSSMIMSNVFVTVCNLSLKCHPPRREIRILLKDLSFNFKRGTNVVISGPSGCGKTSLLRAIAGICKPMHGTVNWNVPIISEVVVFAPQNPVCFAGTMKDNITYPLFGDNLFGSDDSSPEQIKHHMKSWNEAAHNALSIVGLYVLLDPLLGLETEADWPNILSTGEVQRLGMARLFMFRPPLAIIDEATSGLQEHLEAIIYSKLIAMGTTIVTVGNRESLFVYHDVNIVMGIDDCGSYEVKELNDTWSKTGMNNIIKSKSVL
eukprot:194705_1